MVGFIDFRGTSIQTKFPMPISRCNEQPNFDLLDTISEETKVLPKEVKESAEIIHRKFIRVASKSRFPRIFNCCHSALPTPQMKSHLGFRANLQIEKGLKNEAIKNLKKKNIKLAFNQMKTAFEITKSFGISSFSDHKLWITVQIAYAKKYEGTDKSLRESIELFLNTFAPEKYPNEASFFQEIVLFL